jgi:hypothetical protein
MEKIKERPGHCRYGAVFRVWRGNRDITAAALFSAPSERVFALYNKNSGKQVEIKGQAGPERALGIVESAIRASGRKQKK